MKSFLLLTFTVSFILLSKSFPIEDDQSRYIWFPDDHGVMHLVDLQEDSSDDSRVFEPEDDIVYILHTRANPTEGQVLKKRDLEILAASNFNVSNPVKITVHGWIADHTSGTNTKIRDAFLRVADVNMITVDWGKGANTGYIRACRNAKSGAPAVADMIDWLNEVGVSFSNIHLIGHSLGGQFVGLTARACQRGVVEYITAMDPAFPLWGPNNTERISKNDGKYVELIHTNAGMLGMIGAVGHNDFYPAGARHMPGCNNINIQCSHTRSTDFMAASIDHQGFMGTQCNSVQEALSGVENCTGTAKLHLGGINTKPAIGIFALNVNAEPPYYQGEV